MYSGWAQAMTGDAPGGIERLSDGVAVHVNIGQRLGLPWTTDWYRDSHGDPHSSDVDALCCVPTNPSGPDVEASFDPNQPKFPIPLKVIKGGSFVCADNYCRRYRPAARRPQMVDIGTQSHRVPHGPPPPLTTWCGARRRGSAQSPATRAHARLASAHHRRDAATALRASKPRPAPRSRSTPRSTRSEPNRFRSPRTRNTVPAVGCPLGSSPASGRCGIPRVLH